MRDIKFRAWDKEFKKWSQTPMEYSIGSINYFTDYEWCQYTGLKDKNGTEIYEGDIVSNFGREWIVEWDAVNLMYVANELNGIGINILSQGNDNWEVIGDTHENPELMNI